MQLHHIYTDERYNDGNSAGHMWNDKGSTRHKETWWWNEEVAEAVRNKKMKYGKWKKENTEEARMEYKKSRQNWVKLYKRSIRESDCR